jgi:hypothetical protein
LLNIIRFAPHQFGVPDLTGFLTLFDQLRYGFRRFKRSGGIIERGCASGLRYLFFKPFAVFDRLVDQLLQATFIKIDIGQGTKDCFAGKPVDFRVVDPQPAACDGKVAKSPYGVQGVVLGLTLRKLEQLAAKNTS